MLCLTVGNGLEAKALNARAKLVLRLELGNKSSVVRRNYVDGALLLQGAAGVEILHYGAMPISRA